MTYFIIIRGPLGAGKTTIAKGLAKILNAKYISLDKVLEKQNLDKIDHYAECIPAENFIKADDAILPEIKGLLKKGRTVIFDGCFYHKEHIEHLVKNLKYPCFAFTLKAPLKVCIERDSKRKKAYGKEAAASVYMLVSRFDYGIAIDTSKKTIGQVIKEIVSCLPK